jgi:omega-amidase
LFHEVILDNKECYINFMPANKLNLSLIQADIAWEDKDANLKQYEEYIKSIGSQREVAILPEMFSTGFSMNPEKLAETMEGPTVAWMKAMAAKYRCILTGSLIIEEEAKYYNRLIWMQPDGQYGTYDKRHLFAYAGEDKSYYAGEKRFIASVKGWKICLMVCYDLRFPVWSRQSAVPQTNGHTGQPEYDVLVYVANWPERRNLAWKTLLQARAIENQCYVAGVNRVGDDGNDIHYKGESSVFGPLGEMMWQQADEAIVHTLTLDKDLLQKTRTELPFLKDADSFMLL